MGSDSHVAHSALNRGSVLEGEVLNSVLSTNVKVGKGAKVAYSVLLPGAVVEEGATVEYAILGENCHIGVAAKVGGDPASVTEGWGLTVLAPECKVEAGRVVRPGIMLGRNGEEVSK